MDRAIELKREELDLVDQVRKLLANEKRSKAECDQLDKHLNRLDEVKGELRALELQGAGFGTPAGGPISQGFQPVDGLEYANARPAQGKSYRSMFYPGEERRSLDRGGFASFGEFLSVLESGRFDPRLEERAHLEGVPSLGGFAVPEEFAAFLLDASLEDEIVRPRAQIWPMKSETRKVPAWDGSDHTSSLFGGFTGTWLAEGGTATRQTSKIRQLELHARKLAIYTQASRELLDDGLSYGDQLEGALRKATGWYLDDAFINGSGAGRPQGVLNSPSLIEVSKEGGQANYTVIYENVVKMFARLHPACYKSAIWLANTTTIPQLLTMTFPVGTGGNLVPAVVQSGGKNTLLTLPLIFTEKVPALGAVGDIMFVDFSQDAVGLREEYVLDRINAPGWLEDLVDFRGILRADGQGTWDKVITPKNGDSLSWAIALEARS